jgi:hypothetical protein
VENGSRHLKSIICCRVRRSKPGGLGLVGVDMDMSLPGTMRMPMKTTKAQFGITTNGISQTREIGVNKGVDQ